MGSDPLN